MSPSCPDSPTRASSSKPLSSGHGMVSANICNYCRNMDVDRMVCSPGDLYELVPLGSTGRYPTEGYRHQPSLPDLRASARNGCPVCHAMEVEIDHYLDNEIPQYWREDNHLQFSEDPESQIYLHYPTSERNPGLGLYISCRRKIAPSRAHHRVLRRQNPSKYVVIGRIGMYFLPGAAGCQQDSSICLKVRRCRSRT